MSAELAQVVQLAINGMAIGAIYALVALGLVLTYKATEVLNFAYGDVLMASSFVGWGLIVGLGWPFWLAVAGVATRRDDECQMASLKSTRCSRSGERRRLPKAMSKRRSSTPARISPKAT